MTRTRPSTRAIARTTRQPGRASALRSSLALLALAAAAASAGCWDDEDDVVDGVDYGYEDYYLYGATYPSDVMYSSYYWADDWAYDDLYFSPPPLAASGSTARWSVGNALRALARGETLCPGQVTVTPKTTAPACAGGVVAAAATVRNGVTIVFNGCALTGGGVLNGTVDVQSTRSASEATCAATTRITLGHTTTITNLTYTNAAGARIVVPSQTDTGSNNYLYGGSPTSITMESTGQVQIYGAGQTLLSDHNHSGNRTFSFSGGGDGTYTTDGTVMIQDNRASGVTATLTLSGITRSSECCRPTAGTLTVSRNGGVLPGQHAWTFGPSCEAASFDGAGVTLPACL